MSVLARVGVQMIELAASFITGMMFGIEFPDKDNYVETVSFVVVVDLFIVRLVLIRHHIDVDAE